MTKPKAECRMPSCKNDVRARFVCGSHLNSFSEFADIRVQRVIEEAELERDLEKGAGFDWHYLTEDQAKAIEMGVRDAYFENDDLQGYDHENMLQDAWIWAASHKKDVQATTTFTMLRTEAKRKAIRAAQAGWNANRELVSLEAMFEDNEEG